MAGPVANLFKCNACKGTYADRQHDGTLYHHACPPLRPDDHGIEAERPDKRDENLVNGLAFNTTSEGNFITFTGEAMAGLRRGSLTGIRLEGAGVKCLTDATIVEPTWITALKARIAKEEES
jgi:hypothetical protein